MKAKRNRGPLHAQSIWYFRLVFSSIVLLLPVEPIVRWFDQSSMCSGRRPECACSLVEGSDELAPQLVQQRHFCFAQPRKGTANRFHALRHRLPHLPTPRTAPDDNAAAAFP